MKPSKGHWGDEDGGGAGGSMPGPTGDWIDNYVPSFLKDVPRVLMNKSRAWIVEEHVPEGINDPRPMRRTRSRFSEWKSNRKLNGAPRPAHWRIIRMSGDDWEDIRRKDRMVLEEGMETIRNMARRWPNKTLRLRNCKSDDIIMGAILCADIPVRGNESSENMAQMAPQTPPGRGPFSMTATPRMG